MRFGVAPRAVAVTLAVLCLAACSSPPKAEKQGSGPATANRGNDGYDLPDTPFTRKGAVITATCSIGARAAAVVVQAWDPDGWQPLDEHMFDIPAGAAFSNYPGVEAVNSPLVDLCRQSTDRPSPYRLDDLEHMAPRIRALFDLGFTRMAVVFREPDGKATHAGSVASGDPQGDAAAPSGATGNDEQNAAMAPDGRSVWFTYRNPAGEQRIGSRAIQGNQDLTDEGPAAGNELPLTVSGKPPRAIQAGMVRVSPNGRRFTGFAPKVFGRIFDASDSSIALSGKSASNATLVRDCVAIVGWISDAQVLCRAPSGSFQVADAHSGDPVGAAIEVVGANDGTVAEGMVVSADGKHFIAAVHIPNDPYGDPLQPPDLRVVPTNPGGETVPISNDSLSADTVFLAWL
ncbi:hypothetical protein [Micromonospora parathelypteridis]|uniref:Uncharacterized protein n=1 Tax=Micromonospora parathelypteridis TaxID=1839617 RepID=A0A840W8G2_9ACTN|nr:hypothetical protein [Micromonospora parathelypteridis]MBB5480429.1 hypothetical protein [Micromonospora parathelypteridis]